MSQNMAQLTDQELREKLTSLGVDVGPIVDSTRKLYMNKLARLLNPESDEDFSQVSASQQSGTTTEIRGSNSAHEREGGSAESDYDEQVEEFEERTAVAEERYKEERKEYEFSSPSLDSTIHLIRPRKHISQLAREAAGKSPQAPGRSPFPAANAQFRKHSTDDSSAMHHVLKFGCFAVVMIVIVFFILTSNPGSQVDIRSKSS